MEELCVEVNVEDRDKIRDLPGYESVSWYPYKELQDAHPNEYGRMRVGNIVIRFRVYSLDHKTRFLDCLGTVCHHLGMIRREIAEGDDSVETNIYDLNRFVQQTMQAYV